MMQDPNEMIEMNEVQLKWVKFCATKAHTGLDLAQAARNMGRYMEQALNQDAIFERLWTYLATETLETVRATARFQYPANWWEHFKSQYFPQWALNRWPVQMKSETQELVCEATRSYPNLPLPEEYKKGAFIKFAANALPSQQTEFRDRN